ncbi:MAG: hypothetical protein KDI13_03610 [Alphaproteobacteria bacterium]|nr:hypothetical protein [Alphaproteobacteria bacterium]
MTTDEEEILKQTILEEDEEDTGPSLADKLRERKLKQKKKNFKRSMITVAVLLFGYILYWGFKPIQAGVTYDICRTFLELNLFYPDTMRVSEVIALRDNSIKLWFAHTDPFGDYRMESFQCYFGPNPNGGGTIMLRAERNKLEVNAEKVTLFNIALPYLASNPPGFNYPRRLPDSLEGLKFNSDMFRMQIFPTGRR